jgi:hypothetical protein
MIVEARGSLWRITGASVTSDGFLTVWQVPEGQPDDSKAGRAISLGEATDAKIQALGNIEVMDWRRPAQH